MPSTQFGSNMQIRALIDENIGRWKEGLIWEVFSPRDVMKILKIPLICLDENDNIIWRFNCIRLCVDQLVNREKWKVNGDWNHVWSTKAPYLGWRLGIN